MRYGRTTSDLFHLNIFNIQSMKRTGAYNLDQELLAEIIFPAVESISCVHDSYLCQKYVSEHWRPFPTKRLPGNFNFVGSDGPKELAELCPVECRPHNHRDWWRC